MLVARVRKAVSVTLVALMLFAQAVYALDACVTADVSAARAVAMAASMADMPGCEEMRTTSSCLAQSLFDSQSSGSPVAAILAIPSEAVLTIAFSPVLSSITSGDCEAPAHSPGPAPPIRFCRFLF